MVAHTDRAQSFKIGRKGPEDITVPRQFTLLPQPICRRARGAFARLFVSACLCIALAVTTWLTTTPAHAQPKPKKGGAPAGAPGMPPGGMPGAPPGGGGMPQGMMPGAPGAGAKKQGNKKAQTRRGRVDKSAEAAA